MTLSRRQFGSNLGFAALAMLVGSKVNAVPASGDADIDLSFVNPELRPYARKYLPGTPKDGGSSFTLPLVHKEQADQLTEKVVFEKSVPAVKQWIPVPGGPPVAVYLVNAKPGASRPAIVHTHGGGYILGDARSCVPPAQDWAKELDCFVATVEYRLAPETTYKGSMEDNYAALRWVYEHANELGVDRTRIAVMGESAGGGHAALLAQTAHDRGEVPVAFQALIYPMLDDRTGSSRRPSKNAGRLIWTPGDNRFGWKSFLGQEPGTATVPTVAVPARRASLEGLPPAYIAVGSIDLFCDEDITYAKRLTDAGIQTELLVVPGAFHGFDLFAESTKIAKNFTANKMRVLKSVFAGQF
jgi:acetyl esterase/lipase